MIGAVMYKDLRQHYLWLLGAAFLSVVYCVLNLLRWPGTIDWDSVLFLFARGYSSEINATPPLLRAQGIFLLASAYGLVLGFVHGLADIRASADFFFHRPCSRAGLAVAKLLAGTAIYWIPGLAALGLVTAWSAMGNFASPFRIWMLCVPLASWWIGYGFYLAAVNVSWRSGRWYGSRLLPLAVPVLAAIVVLNSEGLAPVLAVILFVTLVFWLVNTHLLVRFGV
ncbi:MAG: hypothetical protein ACYTFA_05070 [Planctomycetota bacterium]|jgi:hypothetical protein